MRSAFENPALLWTLLALPALAILGAVAAHRRRLAASAFAGILLGARLPRRGGWHAACAGMGLALLAVGMAGPRWGRDWTRSAAPGRDLIVVLDLSRSMFAEAPTRAERAKESLLSLADGLWHRSGHRLGLVIFAGKAELVCPPTHDLDHFRAAVEALDPESPPPGLGAGTRIGAGLTLALDSFEGRGREARDVLLISDGDDPARDGEYRSGAAKARIDGVPVHCLAVGDPDKEHEIRLPEGGWLMDGAKRARTRLEEGPLHEITQRAGGRLHRLGAGPIDLTSYYLRWVRESAEDSPDNLPAYHQRQGWFLVPAFLLLALAVWLPETRP